MLRITETKENNTDSKLTNVVVLLFIIFDLTPLRIPLVS